MRCFKINSKKFKKISISGSVLKTTVVLGENEHLFLGVKGVNFSFEIAPFLI